MTARLQEAILFGAILGGAYLDGANLRDANLHGADLRDARDLTADQVRAAKKWGLAYYSNNFLKKLAEPEKEKKTTGGKR